MDHHAHHQHHDDQDSDASARQSHGQNPLIRTEASAEPAGGHVMGGKVSRAEVAAMTLLTTLALIAGLIWSAAHVNLTIGAHEVNGAVMAPGMIMTRDTPAEAMRDMAAVDPDAVRYVAPADAEGGQLLEPRLEDGVKVFTLETSVIEWNILPEEPVLAYAFNQQVPGPLIRLTQGDRVRFEVTNHLPESTTIHWHGLIVPNAMDGPAEITQNPIPPGGTFTYEFTAEQRGTYFYHSHDHIDRQQALGLYGALIIDGPADDSYPYPYDKELIIQLQELLEREGYSWPAMPMEGGLPNFFTINGKAYPATQQVDLKVGETLLVRFIGTSSGFIHPMHIHGGPFRIVETDGNPVEPDGQWVKDTVNIAPGERYDVLWEAREPGKWLLHCHINHHTTNNNVEQEGGGGLMLILNVTE